MRYAEISNNRVINIIEAEPDWISTQQGEYIQSDIANIGWLKDENGFIDPYQKANEFINTFFTNQNMKEIYDWINSNSLDSSQKVKDFISWTNEIHQKAAIGDINFHNPPFTFEEIKQEILN